MALEMTHQNLSSLTQNDGEEKAEIPAQTEQVETAMRASASFPRERSKAEKRLVRKTDILVPGALALTYFFAYIDRGAIGNARIMGLQRDLNFTDDQYFNCLLIFFVGYAVFEGPAFYLIRKFHAPTVYAVAALIFGMCAVLTAFATTYAHVMVLRLVIGLTEATCQTGFLYVSLWYRREEMSVRAGLMFCLAPLAGAVTGLIAYAVQINLEGVAGHHSWQWLFIIEGSATMVWAVLLWFILPEKPEVELAKNHSFWFNDPEERRLIVARSEAAQHVMNAKIEFWQMNVALKDPKVWLLALIFATHGNALNGFAVFLPTFINEFGFSSLITQLFTIIPYVVAFISLIIVTGLADRLVMRSIPMYILTAVASAGFIIILAQTNPAVGIFASCLITGAVYPAVVITSGWIPSSNAGYTKRATATWIAQIMIQCFSIMTSKIYDSPPRFLKGHGVQLGLSVLAFGEIYVMTFLMKRSNAKKDALAAEWEARGEVNPDENKTLEELCDDHPRYRYLY